MENPKAPIQYSKERANKKIGIEYHVVENPDFKLYDRKNENLSINVSVRIVDNTFKKELPFMVSTELKNTFTDKMRDEQGDLKNKKYDKTNIFTNVDKAKLYALHQNIAYKKRIIGNIFEEGSKNNILFKILMKISKESYMKNIDEKINAIAKNININEVKVIDKEYFNIVPNDDIKKMYFLIHNLHKIKYLDLKVEHEGYIFFGKNYYPAYMIENFGKILKEEELKDFSTSFLIPELSNNMSLYSSYRMDQSKRSIKYHIVFRENALLEHKSTTVYLSMEELKERLEMEEFSARRRLEEIEKLINKTENFD